MAYTTREKKAGRGERKVGEKEGCLIQEAVGTKMRGRILEGEARPTSWRKAIIIPIFKKGNIKDCTNYRGISLLNSGYKNFSRIIALKLEAHYKTLIDIETCNEERVNVCSKDEQELSEHLFVMNRYTETNVPDIIAKTIREGKELLKDRKAYTCVGDDNGDGGGGGDNDGDDQRPEV
ncbi:hypothetical protein ANN_24855 [Periplaneta americana]|uniref:Uncharacterized protein n=1 Tax=Periplaneta americana TaxID=6978 RepID=A0ABQ8RZZ0_PERAM|nr:hypothetical protein ANN_24855 [Periplaneta americana]